MIRLIQQGTYRILETVKHTQMLTFDEKTQYAWVQAGEIGGILVSSRKPQQIDYFLSVGKYRMYEIKDEPKLTDLIHLELFVGDGLWQGYLLPTGLPRD